MSEKNLTQAPVAHHADSVPTPLTNSSSSLTTTPRKKVHRRNTVNTAHGEVRPNVIVKRTMDSDDLPRMLSDSS
jgi:hypothetical protein